jgi:uncharacterized membrane protein YphA (DoxX/SURF4 family)
MSFARKLLGSEAPPSVLLVRLAVGSIFVLEGILKFTDPELGVNRFAKIGFPSPDALAHFVGSVEVLCGLLVVLGLATRAAVVPLLAVMATAFVSTKVPLLPKKGFAFMAHEARLDLVMLLSLVFLLVAGAGPLSADARVTAKLSP